MPIKLTVDINAVRRVLDFLDHIDSFPFDEITWMDGEEIITVPPKAAEEWKFVGLCNHSFVEHEGWKFDQGFVPEEATTDGVGEKPESLSVLRCDPDSLEGKLLEKSFGYMLTRVEKA